MTDKVKYKTIVRKANRIRKNVKYNYKIGESKKWSYYIAKAILLPKQDVNKIKFRKAKNPQGTHISRQITKKEYFDIAERLVEYVEKHKALPNYIEYKEYKLQPKVYTLLLSKVLIYFHKYNKLPSEVNCNSKAFTQPVETTNEVYNYFVKTFGDFGNTIDGALSKVDGKGYAYYYDDQYTNKTSIDRIKQGLGINCTDSCQVFYNIMLQLIELGKYKKVECLHVMCSSGGHVKLRITLNDGTKIIRDPACALSDNGNGYKCVWCTNEPIAVNPSWFLENVFR